MQLHCIISRSSNCGIIIQVFSKPVRTKYRLPSICDLQFLAFTMHLCLLKSFLFISMYTSPPCVTRLCHSIKCICMAKKSLAAWVALVYSVWCLPQEKIVSVNSAIIINLSTFIPLFTCANNYLCFLLELVTFCANNFFKLVCYHQLFSWTVLFW